jgi:hypothetical protein
MHNIGGKNEKKSLASGNIGGCVIHRAFHSCFIESKSTSVAAWLENVGSSRS